MKVQPPASGGLSAAPPLEGRRARIRRLVRLHLLLIAALLVYTFVIGRCPVFWLTGVPCPGCGMTRALLHAARLDFIGAFYYHPLWFAVPPALLYLAHQDAWRLPGGKRTRQILIALLGAAFLAVYLYRLFWQANPAVRVDFGGSALARLFHCTP